MGAERWTHNLAKFIFIDSAYGYFPEMVKIVKRNSLVIYYYFSNSLLAFNSWYLKWFLYQSAACLVSSSNVKKVRVMWQPLVILPALWTIFLIFPAAISPWANGKQKPNSRSWRSAPSQSSMAVTNVMLLTLSDQLRWSMSLHPSLTATAKKAPWKSR